MALVPYFCIWTAFLVFLGDFYSKYWIQSSLPLMGTRFPFYPYGGIAVFKNFLGIEFSITHLTNRGAAWGVLEGYQDLLLIARLAMITAMVFYVCRLKKEPIMQFFLCLVIAGALGNVVDYFLYGHVVDMFHFVLWGYDFPVFNVADSAVFIGVCGLLVLSFKQDAKKQRVC